jgi:hypothetical protein
METFKYFILIGIILGLNIIFMMIYILTNWIKLIYLVIIFGIILNIQLIGLFGIFCLGCREYWFEGIL